MRIPVDADGLGDERMELEQFRIQIQREGSAGDDDVLKCGEKRLHHIASIAADEF